MKKLIGIFGGTFDPIHLGHINSINRLNERLKFEQVHWVLSARPPHKEDTTASIEQRFEMLELALSKYPNYQPDDCEIVRKKASYTYDTIQFFRDQYPEYALCLIIGADSFINLHTWHRYQELIEQVHIVVMSRPGYSLEIPDYMTSRLLQDVNQVSEVDTPSLILFDESDYDISSTQIRNILSKLTAKQGEFTKLEQQSELKKFLSVSVISYILRQQNYTLAPQKIEDKMKAEQIKNHVVDAIEDLKGQDIRVIDIKDISDFADIMIVVSGTSNVHVKAMAREASTKLRQLGVKPLGENGADIGEWVLVDFGDVVLHVMRPEVREYYDLEKLWDVDVRELVKQHREQSDS